MSMFDQADAELAMQHAEEIEQQKAEKRRERLRRKLEREHKKKWQRRQKLVAPMILLFSILISALVWMMGS